MILRKDFAKAVLNGVGGFVPFFSCERQHDASDCQPLSTSLRPGQTFRKSARARKRDAKHDLLPYRAPLFVSDLYAAEPHAWLPELLVNSFPATTEPMWFFSLKIFHAMISRDRYIGRVLIGLIEDRQQLGNSLIVWRRGWKVRIRPMNIDLMRIVVLLCQATRTARILCDKASASTKHIVCAEFVPLDLENGGEKSF